MKGIVRRGKRVDAGRMKTGCLILLALAVLLVAGIVVLIVLVSRDERPPNVTDLQVIRVPVSPIDNAYSILLTAFAALKWPANAEGEALQTMPGGTAGWNEESVATFLAENADALQLWEQGVAKGQLQAPEVLAINSLMPYLAQWRSLARAAALKAMYEARTGQPEAAREDAFRIVEYGRMIEKSQGPLISALVGKAVKNIGLTALRDVIAQAPPEPDALPELLARIRKSETDRQVLADVYRTSYQVFSNSLSGVTDGTIVLPEAPKYGLRIGFMFKPNQTRRLHAELTRWAIQDLDRPLYEPREALPEDVANVWNTPPKRKKRPPVASNSIGKILFAEMGGALENVKAHFAKTDWTVRATQVFVALKSCEAANGQLPETLDALVPDYLPEVPIDPFDGQPMKYSKEDRTIYASDEKFRTSAGTIVVP